MDVPNLIPAQRPATSAEGATRSKPDVAAAPSKAIAAAAAAGSTTARPTAPTASTSDRIERSPELERRVAELRLELHRASEEAKSRVAEVSREILEAKQASHETLVNAALGILRGELYFVAS